MTVSVFELFKVGIGPSSSHTVGPMRAARRFATSLCADGVDRITVDLYGSLGATGEGHGTIGAVVAGLAGADPATIEPSDITRVLTAVAERSRLTVLGTGPVGFVLDRDVRLHPLAALPGHPNGMEFTAADSTGRTLLTRRYYSVGGGFVADDDELAQPIDAAAAPVPHPFRSGDELVAMSTTAGVSIASVAMANETATRPESDVREGLSAIWQVMQQCVERGCRTEGVLPGGLGVARRAAVLAGALGALGASAAPVDPLAALDWVNVWALAVNEENAAGGRVVTAPTNGAAGIVPAVLHYYARFVPGADERGVVDFLLTAGAVGALFKMNASISGAEVGCQGEVGSACAMAAAGLAQVLGGSPMQVENAAEIALEHNLGLTCDPIGGLVQVPCIERNAMAAMKAINAARLAMHGDGRHLVSLDQAIRTMRNTGRDMSDKYKETARGGLAATFLGGDHTGSIPVTVNIVEC